MSAGFSDIIRTTPELERACAQTGAEGILSLDTEFVWMSTYRPRLGLVQLGCRSACWGFDCLTGAHTDALRDQIENPSVLKILHDARQDLTHLHRLTGAFPKHVFDTQLAAAFAGFPAGTGLQKLLFEAIGVGLPKTETCTDWTRRPLSEAQVAYALDDVRYLPALRDELLARADRFGTRAWLEEELTKYDEPSLYADFDPEAVWTRIKLHRVRLDPHGFAILKAVATLREEIARELNVPRNWAGEDGSLIDMAERHALGMLRHRLNGGQAEIVRAKYRRAIEEALSLSEEECPENPHIRYIPEVLDAADRALAWLRERAEEIHVDAAAIANRATVTAYVDNVEDGSNPLSTGWRYEAAGQEMATLFGVD